MDEVVTKIKCQAQLIINYPQSYNPLSCHKVTTQTLPNHATTMSYLVFKPKPSTHHMCAQYHLFHTHGPRLFIDSQMS
jgi:hypothetical protein